MVEVAHNPPLLVAVTKLRECYRITSNDEDFKNYRRNIFNDAMLYKDKIAPFSQVIVKNIEMVCDNITYAGHDKFMSSLDDFTNKLDSCTKLCFFSNELHKEILSNFKQTGDKIIKTIQQHILDDKLKRKMNEFTSKMDIELGWLKEIITSLVEGTNKSSQIIRYEATLIIFEPLLLSVLNYEKFLKDLSGKINTLYSRLEDLSQHTNQGILDVIKGVAGEVKGFCRDYHNMTPDYETELIAIADGNPDELHKDYIDGWVPEKIRTIDNKNEKLKEYRKFEIVLKIMENKDFFKIGLITQIYNIS